MFVIHDKHLADDFFISSSVIILYPTRNYRPLSSAICLIITLHPAAQDHDFFLSSRVLTVLDTAYFRKTSYHIYAHDTVI